MQEEGKERERKKITRKKEKGQLTQDVRSLNLVNVNSYVDTGGDEGRGQSRQK